MNDKASGAVFPTGIQLFNGPATLAFSRDRHDVPGGDFGRSANQGEVLLAALAKLRSETSDDAGLLRWAAVLRRSADLDVPLDKLAPLLALARSVDPAGLTNVIVPGRSVLVGKTSAVAIGSGAAELFADVRTDGVVNGH